MDLIDSIATADEVALAVLSSESVCPTAEDVEQWYAAIEAKTGQPFRDHVRRVYLVLRTYLRTDMARTDATWVNCVSLSESATIHSKAATFR